VHVQKESLTTGGKSDVIYSGMKQPAKPFNGFNCNQIGKLPGMQISELDRHTHFRVAPLFEEVGVYIINGDTCQPDLFTGEFNGLRSRGAH